MRSMAALHAMGIDVWVRRRERPAVNVAAPDAAPAAVDAAEVSAQVQMRRPPTERLAPGPAATVALAGTSRVPAADAADTKPVRVALAGARFAMRAVRLGNCVALVDIAAVEQPGPRAGIWLRFLADFLSAATSGPVGAPRVLGDFVWPPRGNAALAAEPQTARLALASWFDGLLDPAPTAVVITGMASTWLPVEGISDAASPLLRTSRRGATCFVLTVPDSVAADAAGKRALWLALANLLP